MEAKETDVTSSINPESPCRYCGKSADICFRLDLDMVVTVPLTTAGSAMVVSMGMPPTKNHDVYICVGCLDEKMYSRDEFFPLSITKPGIS